MRRFLLAVFAAWLCCGGLTALADKPQDKVQVQGLVVDAQGNPVGGARVWAEVHQSQPIDLVADAQGKFTIELPKTRAAGTAIVASDKTQMGIALAGKRGETSPPAELRIVLGETKVLEVSLVGGDSQPVAGARAAVLVGSVELPPVQTDESGKAELRMPADAECHAVYAYKPGQGFDYQILKSVRHPEKSRGWPADGRVALQFGGTKKVAIHVSQPDGKPIAGLGLALWLLQKPGEPEDFNLSFAPALYRTITDEAGAAHFDDLPAWVGMLQFWPSGKDVPHRRVVWDPARNASGNVYVVFDRLVPVSGKVVLPDGRPASGVSILANGADGSLDSFRDQTTTDETGNFQFAVTPDAIYLLTVDDKQWAAPPIDGLVVRPNQPVTSLNFKLLPATRVAGRVVIGPDRRPVTGYHMQAYQYGRELGELRDVELPNHDNHRAVQPMLVHSTQTDSEGRYEFHLGPGKYDLRGPTQAPIEKFAIVEQAELTFDFAVPRPDKGPFSALVVDRRTGQPIAGATLMGIYRHQLAGRDLEMTSDSAGRCQGERELHSVVILACSPDKKLKRVVELGPDDADVTIQLEPPGSATGRLIDSASGKPLAGKEVQTSIYVYLGDEDDPFRVLLTGNGRSPTATSDSDGKFELAGLVVGAEYNVSSQINRTTQMYGSVQLESADKKAPIVLEPRRIYVPLTTEEMIAEALRGDAKRKYAAALTEARELRQHLALVLIDPEEDVTAKLFDLLHSNYEVRSAVDNYHLVFVDATGTAAKDLAKALRFDLPSEEQLPRFILRDVDEEELAIASASDLSPAGRVDKKRLIEFLKASAPEQLDAQKLLDDALADARQTGRRVLIQETGIGCHPCKLLAQYLEKNRDIWQKGFVWVRMDHRWKGTDEVMERIKSGYRGGIPWMAILDADGKLLATSNGPDGENIGFPSSPESIDFFLSTLRQTASQLTADDIQRLRASLEPKKPAE